MPRQAGQPGADAKGPHGHNFIIPVDYDVPLQHGGRLAGPGFEIEAVHTPGHAPDHLCYRLKGADILLSGDHVMGWNTSVIAPPEGHMGSYMRSLELLMQRKDAIYFPAHGGPVREPRRYVKALIFHRRWREGEIAECIRAGTASIAGMVARMYAGIDPGLVGAAALAVLAQLEFMAEKGAVIMLKPGPLTLDQEFALAGVTGKLPLAEWRQLERRRAPEHRHAPAVVSLASRPGLDTFLAICNPPEIVLFNGKRCSKNL